MRRNVARGCAIVGTVLVWLPIIAPLALSLRRVGGDGPWMVDWLMPAELFPVAFAGGLLVLVAALLGKVRRWLVGGLLAAALVALGAGLMFAQVSGLASGAIEPVGWPAALVMGLIIGYALVLAALGVSGIILIRDLYRAPVVA